MRQRSLSRTPRCACAGILVGFAMTLAACPKEQPAPKGPILRWKARAGESLVYRYAMVQHHRAAQAKEPEKSSEKGELRVDWGTSGRAWLIAKPGRVLKIDEAALELTAAKNSLLFPLPPGPLTAKGDEHAWVVKGLGGASNLANPDQRVRETVRLVSADRRTARVAWTRTVDVVSPPQPKTLRSKQHALEKGQGTFDLAAGRYVALQTTQTVTYELDIGAGKPRSGTLKTAFKLTLDLARSKARTALRRRMEQSARTAERGVAEYVRQHPASAELRGVVDEALKGDLPVGTPAFAFHATANPLGLWREGLASHRSAEERERFVRALSLLQSIPAASSALSDEVVALLRPRVAGEPALQRLVAGLPDPRWKTALEALASAQDPQISERARKSLSELAAEGQGDDPRALRARAADPGAFAELGHRLILGDRDPKALVAVLIEVLEAKDTPPFSRQLCVQWLEGITRRVHGDDVAAWQAFWRQNKDRPFNAWLVDVARSGSPLLRINALMGLGQQPPSRAGLQELLAGLASPLARVRLNAAAALASWRDGRAVPVLLELLAHPTVGFRQTAFVQLARFHDATLGYRPEGPEEQRAAALGRWRGWAARAKLQRVDPRE